MISKSDNILLAFEANHWRDTFGIARISKAAHPRGQLTAFRVEGLFGADLSEKKGRINQL